MPNFGKYEVLEKIGTGGFGVVYRAFDPHIKRLVAIKTCTTGDEEVRTRFFHEAEIAGNLQHRNVVTVYDFGVQEEVPYLVQEYLSGEDLDDKVKRKKDIPYDDRISWLLQIARGMEFAHSKGVVHRDIKPANIRILEDGTAKIMDFGIAKLAQRHTGLTQTGMTLGTAAYLAPEQIRGEPVDPRTDIFSFGALAYELLTFKKAFEGETISAVLYQILHKDPAPVLETWPEAPAAVIEIVARCLAKDTAERFATTAEVVEALDRLLQSMRAPKPAGPTQIIDTSGMPTTALRTLSASPPEAVAAPAAGVQSRGPDLDLSFHREPAAPATPNQPRQDTGRPSRRAGLWAALAVGAVIVAGAAWYLTQPSSAPPPASTPAAAPPSAPRPGTAPPQLDPAAVPGAALTPAPSPSESGGPAMTDAGAGLPASGAPIGAAAATGSASALTPTTAPGPSDAGVASAKPPATAPPPAPAPKPPAKARVKIAPAWDPRATVTVDNGAAQTLDRETRIELTPGSHELVFELMTADFRDVRSVRVEAVAGKEEVVAVPLQPPGQLTIQPALGGPLGLVRLDGEDLGQSPIRARIVASGPHRLEIVPVQGGSPIVSEVTVKPSTLTTVTFDLGKGEVTNLHDRALGGS